MKINVNLDHTKFISYCKSQGIDPPEFPTDSLVEDWVKQEAINDFLHNRPLKYRIEFAMHYLKDLLKQAGFFA